MAEKIKSYIIFKTALPFKCEIKLLMLTFSLLQLNSPAKQTQALFPLSFYEFAFDNGGVDKITALLLFLIVKRLRLDCWHNNKVTQTH